MAQNENATSLPINQTILQFESRMCSGSNAKSMYCWRNGIHVDFTHFICIATSIEFANAPAIYK